MSHEETNIKQIDKAIGISIISIVIAIFIIGGIIIFLTQSASAIQTDCKFIKGDNRADIEIYLPSQTYITAISSKMNIAPFKEYKIAYYLDNRGCKPSKNHIKVIVKSTPNTYSGTVFKSKNEIIIADRLKGIDRGATFVHELGHYYGLKHSSETAKDIMNPGFVPSIFFTKEQQETIRRNI